MRELLVEMSERQRLFEDRLKRYDQRITEFARADERAGRLMAVEGVGPLTATALIAAVGNARQFRSGRELTLIRKCAVKRRWSTAGGSPARELVRSVR